MPNASMDENQLKKMTVKRLRLLEHGIGFVSEIVSPPVMVVNEDGSVDDELSKLLAELVTINERRNALIKKILHQD